MQRENDVRKKLTILAAVGGLAVALGIASSWQEIRIRYHVHRLHSEPDHLRSVLDAPEGTPEKVALREYLKTREGQKSLMNALLLPDLIQRVAEDGATHVALWVDVARNEVHFMNRAALGADGVEKPANRQGFTSQCHHMRVDWRWLPLADEYLSDGDQLTSSRHPDLTFVYMIGKNLPR